jgi:hypothetical protein
MPEKKSSNVVLIITLAMGLFGALFGLIIIPDPNVAASRVRFEPVIPQPPERPVAIAGSSFCTRDFAPIVAVTGKSGRIFEYCEGEWRLFEMIGSPWPYDACEWEDPQVYSPDFGSLYFPVAECSLRYEKGFDIEETVYVILEDHSIWGWNFRYGLTTFILYVGIGVVAGFIIGFVIGILVKGIMAGE